MKIGFHPAADAFPMMDTRRYAELLQDIKNNGLLQPILLCKDMILDGRNRYKACIELGIEPTCETYEGDPWTRAWSLNGQRRDLVQEQRYLIWKFCHEHSEAWQAEKQRITEEANRKRAEATKAQHEVSKPYAGEKMVVEQIVPPPLVKKHKERQSKAKSSKTNAGAVARGDKLAKERPDLAEKVRLGRMKPAVAHKAMQKEKNREAQAKAIEEIKNTSIIIECADFKDFMARHCFDVVITDPPYSREHIHLYEELAEICGKKGVKLLAVMTGQSYLPEIMPLMAKHMPYRWVIAYLTPGGQSVQLWDRKVNTFWKPVIVMGEAANEWFGDVSKSNVNDNDKKHHEWGQSESGMMDLIKRLTRPEDIICDPFCGAGTTGVAAILTGRKFIGCDINDEHLETTKGRIMQCLK